MIILNFEKWNYAQGREYKYRRLLFKRHTWTPFVRRFKRPPEYDIEINTISFID